jgi:uncharacterized protein YbbK (DUF523 family)
MDKLLVSACTVGQNTRFDGRSIEVAELVKLVEKGKAVPFCAEVSAGFPTPRKPAEIENGKVAADVLDGNARVITADGDDVTEGFILGAQNVLEKCKEEKITIAILRENSPSCGSSQVYDGKFNGNRISGNGIVAELLRRNGIQVYSHENFPRELIDKMLNEI